MQHGTSIGAGCGLSAALLFAVLAHHRPALADYPIASHRYLADPGALVSNGRVYLYNSNDDDNPVEGDYQMRSIVCISSSDLKNWTDHGEVFRAPTSAAWAGYSWAPAAVERNGKVYLYFGNNASGVGVATSTSPTAPFSDARGSALVDASTPGASGTNSWLFDPSVFVDDDGQAYLTFGGNGDDNARIIRLNSDMISVSGPAIALSIPTFFEASWLSKRNGVYYFSYSTTPAAGQSIDYLTSSSPTSGFSYRGTAAAQPPSNNNNNHHSIFELGGAWYHAYHNRVVATQAGVPPTYRRNLGLERLEYDADGAIQPVTYTTDGVTQLASLNPYVRVEGETTNAQSGIETEPCSAGGMDVTDLQDGDWTKVRAVDFGSVGAQRFDASVASSTSGGSIELHLDDPNGTLIGTCAVPATGGPQIWTAVTCPVTGAAGVHDLYLRFAGVGSPLFNLDYWQFTAGSGSPLDPDGSEATGSAGASGIFGVAGFGDARSGVDGAGAVTGTGGAATVGGSPGARGGDSGAVTASQTRDGCGLGARSPSSGARIVLLLTLSIALRARRRRGKARPGNALATPLDRACLPRARAAARPSPGCFVVSPTGAQRARLWGRPRLGAPRAEAASWGIKVRRRSPR
jgi:arabinoxylan arabinofuranohydrolase